jgi:hypothetical protein
LIVASPDVFTKSCMAATFWSDAPWLFPTLVKAEIGNRILPPAMWLAAVASITVGVASRNAPLLSGEGSNAISEAALPIASTKREEAAVETRAAVAYRAGEPLTIETVQLDGPKDWREVLVEVKTPGSPHGVHPVGG